MLRVVKAAQRLGFTLDEIVLGRRARLFEGTHTALEVESSTTSPTGIVVASYRVVLE